MYLQFLLFLSEKRKSKDIAELGAYREAFGRIRSAKLRKYNCYRCLVSMLAVPILQMEIMNDRIKSSADLVPYDFVAFGYKG